MISAEDALYTYEYREYYKILPVINNWSSDPGRIKDGIKVAEGFVYASDNNSHWMSVEELSVWIAANRDKIGSI
jgi:hypothetical protein